jgi:hypothetical protein
MIEVIYDIDYDYQQNTSGVHLNFPSKLTLKS